MAADSQPEDVHKTPDRSPPIEMTDVVPQQRSSEESRITTSPLSNATTLQHTCSCSNEAASPRPDTNSGSRRSSTLVGTASPSNTGSILTQSPTTQHSQDQDVSGAAERKHSYWPEYLNAQNVLVLIFGVFTVVSVIMQYWANRAQWFSINKGARSRNGSTERLDAPPFSHFAKYLSAHGRWYFMLGSFALGVLLAFLALGIYRSVVKRRAQQPRMSDQSMARRDFSFATTSGADLEPQNDMAKRRADYYRMFVSADKAINHLKTTSNNQSSYDDSRRSSNPFGRRPPWRSNSYSSLLDEAEIFYPDPDGSRWIKHERPVRSDNSSSNSLSTFRSKLDLPTPPPTPPLPTVTKQETATEEVHTGPIHRLKHLFTPKHIQIFDHPPPELPAGDFETALAFIGAIGAAPAGGHALEKCPVDVTPEKGLPESWMHLAPQDSMSA